MVRTYCNEDVSIQHTTKTTPPVYSVFHRPIQTPHLFIPSTLWTRSLFGISSCNLFLDLYSYSQYRLSCGIHRPGRYSHMLPVFSPSDIQFEAYRSFLLHSFFLSFLTNSFEVLLHRAKLLPQLSAHLQSLKPSQKSADCSLKIASYLNTILRE